MKSQSDQAAYLSLTTASILWGASVIAQKLGVTFFPPVQLALARGIGATLCLVPLWLTAKGARTPWRAADLFLFLILGFLSMVGNQLFNYYGLRLIPASEAGMIIGLTPVVTVLLAALFFGEPLRRRRIVGSMLSFLGVVLIVLRPRTGEAIYSWQGDLLIGLGVLSWVLYTLLSRAALARHSAMTVTFGTISIGTALLVPLSFFQGGGSGLWENAPVSAWMALLYLIFFASVVAFISWNKGLQAIGPTRASVFSNLIPISALFFGTILLSESVSARQLMGMGLILTGVWLVNKR
jgi:drug/metabolite transporter (DMT)-like permease